MLTQSTYFASTESIRPSSYGTKGSEETTATTVVSAIDGGDNRGIGGAVDNVGLGAANNAERLTPGGPLTTVAIGAQFAGQLLQEGPVYTLEEQRQARMTWYRGAFLELEVHVPEELLERLESVNYNMTVPDIFVAQFSALRSQGRPMERWESAEDAWNAITRELRPRFPDQGMLWGWDELEELPFGN